MTFSIGVVTFHSLPRNVDELVHAADEMMYKVKESGKNRVELKVI